MYIDGKKALLMIKDPDIKNKIGNYLFFRYNLLTESVDGILEVLQQISGDSSYELVILDETVAGLATASQTLINIKDRDFETNVLYLSTLLEITDPYFLGQLDLLPHFSDTFYRLDQTNTQLQLRLDMHSPVMRASTMEEVYPVVCRRLAEAFNADGALCANLRLGVEPVTSGIMVGNFPWEDRERYEFHIPSSGYFRELITYYRPVHIPDLDEYPEFRRELEEKFSFPCRSILLLPMQLAGKCVGFIGMYMRESSRVFNLVEIELSQRLADTAAAVLVSIFFKKHVGVPIDRLEEKMIG
ncbi:MAG: GAF domain-containing protein [Candidatus Aminicenantes bacterium]|nr:GAF domain-containing protein [Candidatus Aminicenantes bacterium]